MDLNHKDKKHDLSHADLSHNICINVYTAVKHVNDKRRRHVVHLRQFQALSGNKDTIKLLDEAAVLFSRPN